MSEHGPADAARGVDQWRIVQIIDSMFDGVEADEVSYEEFVEMIDLVDPEMLKKMNIGG